MGDAQVGSDERLEPARLGLRAEALERSSDQPRWTEHTTSGCSFATARNGHAWRRTSVDPGEGPARTSGSNPTSSSSSTTPSTGSSDTAPAASSTAACPHARPPRPSRPRPGAATRRVAPPGSATGSGTRSPAPARAGRRSWAARACRGERARARRARRAPARKGASERCCDAAPPAPRARRRRAAPRPRGAPGGSASGWHRRAPGAAAGHGLALRTVAAAGPWRCSLHEIW